METNWAPPEPSVLTRFEKQERHFLCNFAVRQIFLTPQSKQKLVYLKLKIGHKKFTHPSPLPIVVEKNEEEPTTVWKTTFTTGITPHTFLFSSIIVDLYERKFFGTRRIYLGRGQIKLEKLINQFDRHSDTTGSPFTINIRLDLYPFKYAPSNTCLLQQKYFPPICIGYVDLQLLVTPHVRDEYYRCDCILPSKDLTQIDEIISNEMDLPQTAVQIEHAEMAASTGESAGILLVKEQTLQCGPDSQLETLFQLSIFQKDNTMKVVQSILREISDGAVFSRREFLENMIYLQRVYAKHIPRKMNVIGKQIQNPKTEIGMEETFRAWNFVIASFGWRGIYSARGDYSGTILRMLREQTDILDLKLFFEDVQTVLFYCK